MHQLKTFNETRVEVLADLMMVCRLANVMHGGSDGPQANALTLFSGTNGRLRGPVAQTNLLGHADGASVFVIFYGLDACVSPNWYPSKHEADPEQPWCIDDVPADHVLHPQASIATGGDPVCTTALHENAHHSCFIANHVNFPVRGGPCIEIVSV